MLGNCDEVIESVNLKGYCDNECQFFVDRIYNDVVSVLNNAAHICVPQSHKNFYKFWWGEELKIAKAQSVESNNIWKAVGKPRHGPVFEKRNKYRLAYRQLIREEQKREKLSYTNDLHDALLKKGGRAFWNCWRSEFERSAPCMLTS